MTSARLNTSVAHKDDRADKSFACRDEVLLDGGAHPVDLGVAGDGGVVDVDHDHLVVPCEGISYRSLIG